MTEETVIAAPGVPKARGCLLVHAGPAELCGPSRGQPHEVPGKHSTPVPSSFTPICTPDPAWMLCLLDSHSDQSRRSAALKGTWPTDAKAHGLPLLPTRFVPPKQQSPFLSHPSSCRT